MVGILICFRVNLSVIWTFILGTTVIVGEGIIFKDKRLKVIIVNSIFPGLIYFIPLVMETWISIGNDFGNMPYDFLGESFIGFVRLYIVQLLSVWCFTFLIKNSYS